MVESSPVSRICRATTTGRWSFSCGRGITTWEQTVLLISLGVNMGDLPPIVSLALGNHKNLEVQYED